MKLNINFDKKVAPIRAMHAVGQPPRISHWDGAHMHYLTEANIPYSRLHDVGYPYGSSVMVDIPNIFPDFSADANDPESYDFTFTDLLMSQLHEARCEPIYRLGVTIENAHYIKAFKIYPPSDFKKWAQICEHIVRHYNEGWADGFKYGITYWEIWNEPENHFDPAKNPMWKGNIEQYYELYEISAKHLKACFGDSIKVGGYASCGFYSEIKENPDERDRYFTDCAERFLDLCKEREIPLDFFSWHSYASVSDTERMADFLDKVLTERGLEGIETQLNEWNNAARVELRGSVEAAAKAAAMMLAFQNKKTTILCYYDAQISQSVYGGMFNPITYRPFPLYYGFKAFGELYALGTQVEVRGLGDGIYAVAAVSSDGERRAVMLANVGEAVTIETDLAGMKLRSVDETHSLDEIEVDSTAFTLAKNQVILLTNY